MASSGQVGQVLTIEELADYLRVSKSAIYRLVQEGRLPGRKVGRSWRFSRPSIDAWLAGGGLSSDTDDAATRGTSLNTTDNSDAG